MGGTTPALPTAKQFVAMAASQIGTMEGRDDSGNWNNLTKYGKWYGMDGVAWCGIFVSWVAFMVGGLGSLVPKYASCWHGLKWFRDRDQSGNWPPQAGDIFIMREYHPGLWNSDADGWATIHTGIVEKYLGNGRVQTIEGNTNNGGSAQGNGVYRLVRQDSQDGKRFIYCRPKWAPEPAPAPSTSTTKPTTKPIFGSIYTGPTKVVVAHIRPGYRNESVRRFNAQLWKWICANNPAYAKANVNAWKNEASALYGTQAQRATQEAYRILNSRNGKLYGKVTLPTWPGTNGVKAIGCYPVARL